MSQAEKDDRMERMRQHQKSLHRAEEQRKRELQQFGQAAADAAAQAVSSGRTPAESHQIAQDARSQDQAGPDPPPVLSLPPRKPQQPQKAKAKRRPGGFKPASVHDRQIEHKGRLPDGARYETRYCAASEKWTGTLHITLEGGRTEFFTGSASGLFKLLHWLDDQWRNFLRQSSPAKVAPSPPAGENAS